MHQLLLRTATLFCLILMVACGSGEEGGQTGNTPDSVPIIDTSSAVLPDSLPLEDKIRILTDRIKFSAENWQLFYERSLLYYESGNTVQAMADIDKAIDYNVTNPKLRHMRGFYFYVQNKDSLAMHNFKNAADLGSDDPETFYHLGQIHFFKNQFPDALDAYDVAISLDSMEPTYHFAKGFLYQDQKNYKKAIEKYEEALSRNPAFIKALAALHDIYLNVRKDGNTAYKYNERIIIVDSLHPLGRFNKGNYFFEKADNVKNLKDEDEFNLFMRLAITEFSKALIRDPNFSDAHYRRGFAFMMIEQYENAIKDFDKVLELDPVNELAFFMRGSIYELGEDYPSALSNYEQALKLNPQFRDAEVAVREVREKVSEAGG